MREMPLLDLRRELSTDLARAKFVDNSFFE